MLCDVIPVNPETGRPDNSLPGGGINYPSQGLPGGGHIMPPIVLPPLPGIWPPPGKPNVPDNSLPGKPVYPSTGPIYIPIGPDNELPVPPGTIWPPLPPDMGIAGKYVILILVLGVGYRWLVAEAPPGTWPPIPPTATPK